MAQTTLFSVVVATAASAYFISRQFSYQPFSTVITSLAIVVPAYFVIWLSWLFPFYFSQLRHVPTVPGFPLWGQFLNIILEECGVPQRRWHQQHGPIIRYFFPFGAERLSIADDDALKHMTTRNPYNYPKPVRAKLWMVRILGEGLLLAEGQEHIHQRKLLAAGFSIQSIRALAPIFWQKALLLTDCWRREMQDNGASVRTFEALEWLNRTTLDIIGSAGFGYDINSLENPQTPIREAYRLVFAFDVCSRILHGLQAFIPATKYIPAQMNRDVEMSRGIILDKATEIIQANQSDMTSDSKDIIALISRGNNKLWASGERGLSFATMRDQIMTFLGAGHDTTATGVAWTLHLLSTHPEVQSRLQEEIRDHMPFLFNRSSNPQLSLETLAATDPDQLPYLNNVCRESLRYIPPIPMTVRQSIADDTLGGYHVPAGTVIYILANAINRLPSYWGETADRFDPDRWNKLPATWTNNAFMTFLQGPRGCIGRKFAETEMKIILCCLLSMYKFERDISTDDPEKWKMWRLVLRPKDGVNLKVTTL